VNFLEKKMKSNPTLSRDDTIQTAVAALQAVLSEDFKATEIEVGVVSSAGPSVAFHVLSTEEVEEHLTAISERE
jgi:20S proteasome subunit alpha 1